MNIQTLASAKQFSDERFTKKMLHKNEDSAVFVLNFKSGQELPAHKHPGSTVYLLVLEGEGELAIDNVQHKVVKDDCILVEGTEQLAFRNTGQVNTSLYVMLSKIPHEDYVKEI